MKFFILALFFTVFAMNISAQQTVLNPLNSTPYIDVTGQGEIEIIPDEIFISFTLKERMDGKNKITIAQQEKKLRTQLQEINFDFKNLSLADASADYTKVRWRKKDFMASKDFTIKVNNVPEVNEIFIILDDVNAKDATIAKTSHSKIQQFRKDVKIMAIKAAKEKAAYLLEAIGEKVGSPLYIQEKEYYEPLTRQVRVKSLSNMKMDVLEADKLEPEISFQKIKLKYKVSARFAIKRKSF